MTVNDSADLTTLDTTLDRITADIKQSILILHSLAMSSSDISLKRAAIFAGQSLVLSSDYLREATGRLTYAIGSANELQLRLAAGDDVSEEQSSLLLHS